MDTSAQVWQQQEHDQSGKSKVASMVERIQESLATQRLEQAKKRPITRPAAPSSSSPLPEITGGSRVTVDAASPLQVGRVIAKKEIETPTRPRPRNQQGGLAAEKQALHSDQFKNAEIDGDDTPRAQANSDIPNPARLHLQGKASLPAFNRPSISKESQRPPPPSLGKPPQLEPVIEDLEEFGDDMDFSIEDLEELMSQPRKPASLYDVPEHPNAPPSRPSVVMQNQSPLVDESAKPQVTDLAPKGNNQHAFLQEDDGDEFDCGDIDEDSFAQAEISATQAFRASHPSSNFVTKNR